MRGCADGCFPRAKEGVREVDTQCCCCSGRTDVNRSAAGKVKDAKITQEAGF